MEATEGINHTFRLALFGLNCHLSHFEIGFTFQENISVKCGHIMGFFHNLVLNKT